MCPATPARLALSSADSQLPCSVSFFALYLRARCSRPSLSRRGPGSAGFRGCGKTQNSVILSEAKNLSLFLLLYLNRREILRFAQNDRTRPFFRSLWGSSLHGPKPAG